MPDLSFQDIILSQALIIVALLAVFFVISRWALAVLREYPGYALGWMMGLFFIIVRISVGGSEPRPEDAVTYVNGLQVFVSTLFGLLVGSVILLALRFGMKHARAVALQVAAYTALNIILIFLVAISSNPVFQKMIGIFSLAIGIAALFAMVLFPTPQHEHELNIRSQGVTQTQGTQPLNAPNPQNPNPGQGGGNIGSSRLDEIRKNQRRKLGR